MDNRLFLHRYRLSRGRTGRAVELHRTPNSITYRAQDAETGREVALELVPFDRFNSDLRERLEHEAAVAREINQIGVPKLYDFGFDGGELVYVTESYDGHTATAWLAARGPLPVAAVLRIALQVVAAVEATAFHRIHHHALNPDNLILLSGENGESGGPQIKVLHWLGVAPLFTETGDERLDNAARFVSPEQLYAGMVDVRSEIYSLGCIMWFLLTGAPPALATLPDANGKMARTEELTGIPKIVAHLLGRMLRLEPEERPQDPVALTTFLQTCLARVEQKEKAGRRFGLPVAQTASVVERRRSLSMAPKTWAIAALLIALALLAAVALPRFLGPRQTVTRTRSDFAPLPTRNELAVLPHQRVAPIVSATPAQSVNQGDPVVEVPRDEHAALAESVPVGEEPAPPQEGPTQDAIVSVPTEALASATPAPEEVAPQRDEGTPAPIALARNEVTTQNNDVTQNAVATQDDQGVVAEQPPQTDPEIFIDQPPASDAPALAEVSSGATPPDTAPADASAAEADASRADDELAVIGPPSIPVPGGDAVAQEEIPPAVAPATPDQVIAPVVTRKASQSIAKTKTRSKSVAKSQVRKSSRSSKVAVKRAKPIPKLHFGSSPAELVGTTSDGRWILSVTGGGRRIIVPPPPGYGR